MYSQIVSSTPLWLKVGETRTLSAASEAQVRIARRGIVRAVDGDGVLRIIGMKPGSTTLTIDGESHIVHVAYARQQEFYSEVKKALSKMLGLKIYSDESQLQIRGTLLRFQDWRVIAEIARRYQGDYQFAAQALPDVAEESLRHLQALIRARGIPVMRFSHDPQFTAHIPKGARALEQTARDVLSAYGIRVQHTESDLSIEPLIRTRVILAEVSKSTISVFGVNWPGEYSARVLPTFSGDSSLDLQLQALENQGKAQVLASPTLLCRSGGKAEFHAGGEFPIRSSSRYAQSVTWKSHGVLLKVRPRADFHGALSVELETEISLLDMAGAVEGVPAIKKNSVKSHFDLPGKRTIALSGLLRQELGRTRAGLPLLSSLPILGPLFGSRTYMNQQSELVVFVTPEIHTPESDSTLGMPEGWVTHGF